MLMPVSMEAPARQQPICLIKGEASALREVLNLLPLQRVWPYGLRHRRGQPCGVALLLQANRAKCLMSAQIATSQQHVNLWLAAGSFSWDVVTHAHASIQCISPVPVRARQISGAPHPMPLSLMALHVAACSQVVTQLNCHWQVAGHAHAS